MVKNAIKKIEKIIKILRKDLKKALYILGRKQNNAYTGLAQDLRLFRALYQVKHSYLYINLQIRKIRIIKKVYITSILSFNTKLGEQ